MARGGRARALQVGFGFAAAILALVTVYLIRDVIGAFVLGAVLAFLISPAVDAVARLGIPRSVAILGVFAILLVAIAGLVTMMAPLLTDEIDQLKAQAPAIAATAQSRLSRLQGQPLNVLGITVDLSTVTATVDQHANEFLLGSFGNALSLGIAAISTVLQVVLTLIVAFLIAIDSHRISRFLRSLTPNAYLSDFDQIWGDVKAMLYAYMRGQLVIASLIGVFSGLAVWLLGLKFALALGLLAGLTALVPYLGPVLGAVPAVLVGLASSPQQAVFVALAYLAVSNVILNLVYPKVVGSAVRLPPLLVIVAFIAGFSLAGILGMFVAVPIAAVLRILYDHIHPRVYGVAR